jgi:hypothetical protein
MVTGSPLHIQVIGTRPGADKYHCAPTGKTVHKCFSQASTGHQFSTKYRPEAGKTSQKTFPCARTDNYNPTKKKSIRQSMFTTQKASTCYGKSAADLPLKQDHIEL